MSAEGEQGKPHSGTVGQVTPSSAQRRCPRAGVFLSALTRESCHFSTAVPGPQCHTRQVKGVPVGFAPGSEQLPPCTTECLYPKLLRSSPQLAQGQARNNTKPHLQRAQARSNLAILVKERQRDLSQPVPALPPCALHSSGRAEQRAQGSDPCGFCPFPLQQQRSTGSHAPLHLSGDPAVHIHFRLKLLVIC